MLCDMCRKADLSKLMIESNVKSSVYYRMVCWLCGYQVVKRINVKRGGLYA